jgi:hypothetical protein
VWIWTNELAVMSSLNILTNNPWTVPMWTEYTLMEAVNAPSNYLRRTPYRFLSGSITASNNPYVSVIVNRFTFQATNAADTGLVTRIFWTSCGTSTQLTGMVGSTATVECTNSSVLAPSGTMYADDSELQTGWTDSAYGYAYIPQIMSRLTRTTGPNGWTNPIVTYWAWRQDTNFNADPRGVHWPYQEQTTVCSEVETIWDLYEDCTPQTTNISTSTLYHVHEYDGAPSAGDTVDALRSTNTTWIVTDDLAQFGPEYDGVSSADDLEFTDGEIVAAGLTVPYVQDEYWGEYYDNLCTCVITSMSSWERHLYEFLGVSVNPVTMYDRATIGTSARGSGTAYTTLVLADTNHYGLAKFEAWVGYTAERGIGIVPGGLGYAPGGDLLTYVQTNFANAVCVDYIFDNGSDVHQGNSDTYGRHAPLLVNTAVHAVAKAVSVSAGPTNAWYAITPEFSPPNFEELVSGGLTNGPPENGDVAAAYDYKATLPVVPWRRVRWIVNWYDAFKFKDYE